MTWWVTVVLLAVICISIGTPLVGRRVFLGTDLLKLYEPWSDRAPAGFLPNNAFLVDTVNSGMPNRAQVRNGVIHGHYPLWNEYASGGTPLGTVPDQGQLSPLNLPFLLLPLWYAPAITKSLELLVAAGFTFLFLRRLGLSRSSALLGGLIFMNSGFIVGWTNWPQAQVASLIPVLFWSVERGIQVRRAASIAPVAVTFAVMVLAGFPYVTAVALIAAGIYVLVRLVGSGGVAIRRRIVIGLLIGGAVALGAGIAALQLLPFREHLNQVSLGYRMTRPRLHVIGRSLITLAMPNAFGSPVNHNYFGNFGVVGQASNDHEMQSFIGASALVLITVAAASGRRALTLSRGIRGYLWIGTVLVAVLVYYGGAPLGLVQHVSLFRTNFIGRARAIFGFFLALLAAMGFEALLANRARSRVDRRRLAAMWVGVAVLSVFAARSLWRIAGVVGQRGYVARHSVIPLAAAAVTVAVILLSGQVKGALRRSLLFVVPVVIGIESLAFVVPYWPRTARADFYPTTPAIEFLQRHLGHDRIAPTGSALFAGTTTYYGIRAAAAHAFQYSDWLALLKTANAGHRTRFVNPVLAPTLAVADSPVLDRMAAKYLVTDPSDPVFGQHEVVSTSAGKVLLRPNTTVEIPVPSGPIRGITVLAGPASFHRIVRLRADVVDASGRILTTGSLRLDPVVHPGPLTIPVVELGSSMRSGGELRVRLTLESTGGSLMLAASARGGVPALSLVLGGADRLRLVFVTGVQIYQRLDALPRIRWAGSAEVVPNPTERLYVMSAPVDPNVVILDEAGAVGSGKGGTLRILTDGDDRISVQVNASGAGYVVVADSLPHGWKAAIDGRPARIIPAEHAMGAVFVPSGGHRVTFRYDPMSWRDGLLITSASLLVLVVMVLASFRRRRPAPPEDADGRPV